MDRQRQLAERVAAQGVRDERILQALRRISRADFVPSGEQRAAFRDRPVPIPDRQTTSQPSLIALMIEALALTGDETVLEVGTGYGFQTALLAQVAAHVWSIEVFPALAEAARGNLERAGIANVDVRVGDGTEGIPDAAPFDAVIVSAAFPEVPPPLVGQLAEGGRLIQPVGPGGTEQVTLFGKSDGRLRALRVLTAARFVPLTGRYGYRR
jgi:protein-L-isoaspartate(D-aspartate) O-methyltransferase